MRRVVLFVLVLAPAVAACGGDAAPPATSGATTTAAGLASSTSLVTTTSEPVTTTTAPTTTAAAAATSTTTTSTTAAGPTALDDLEPFFSAAADVDRRVREAAIAFNAGFDPEGPAIDDEAHALIETLDHRPLRALLPAGMSPELETAVLAVYADLSSRVASLQGGARYTGEYGDTEWVLDCLEHGAVSVARYDDDVARARDQATAEPPPSAAPDSPEAGMLAARLAVIDSMNFGCESCGGVQYDEPFPVDWEGRTVLGVGFEAEFDGTAWEILLYAC
jgi:hypothetical protein